MPGLPWYQIATDFSKHPKTLHLVALLGDRNAGMHVVRLFEHCGEHALDGRIHGSVVEGAAGWLKKRGRFIAAAETAGFLEPSGDVFILHGWEERNGTRIKKWVADSKKPRGNKPLSPESPDDIPPPSPFGPPRDNGGTLAGQPLCPSGVDKERDLEEEEASSRASARPPAAPPAAEAGEGIGPGLAGTVDPLRPTDTIGELRRRLALELVLTGSKPLPLVRADQRAPVFLAALQAYGVEYVATACADHCRTVGKVPDTLDWLEKFVRDLPPPPRALGELPRPEDPDFNDVEAWPTWRQWNERDSGRSARSA